MSFWNVNIKTQFSANRNKSKTTAIFGKLCDLLLTSKSNSKPFIYFYCSTCHSNGVASCEQNVCLIDESLVHNVNSISNTLGWKATNYSEFWGRKYQDGLELRLGTKEPTYKVKAMTKLSNRPESLPRSFDSRNNWPGLITGIRDQGWCGSSWAISTASVASDRFGIQTKGKEAVELAPQHLLSCVRKQSGCSGAHLDWAWNYIRKIG